MNISSIEAFVFVSVATLLLVFLLQMTLSEDLLVIAVTQSLFRSENPSTSTSAGNNGAVTNASLIENLSNTPLVPIVDRVIVDRINGLYMLYPSNWTPSIAGLSYPEVIRLYSPSQNATDFLPAQVSISVTKYLNNSITLPQFTNLTISSLKFALANQSHTQQRLIIKREGPVNISGNPGYSITYSSTLPLAKKMIEFDTLNVWTVVANNKLYFISYKAESPKFLKYLPEAAGMIDSIQLPKTR